MGVIVNAVVSNESGTFGGKIECLKKNMKPCIIKESRDMSKADNKDQMIPIIIYCGLLLSLNGLQGLKSSTFPGSNKIITNFCTVYLA